MELQTPQFSFLCIQDGEPEVKKGDMFLLCPFESFLQRAKCAWSLLGQGISEEEHGVLLFLITEIKYIGCIALSWVRNEIKRFIFNQQFQIWDFPCSKLLAGCCDLPVIMTNPDRRICEDFFLCEIIHICYFREQLLGKSPNGENHSKTKTWICK